MKSLGEVMDEMGRESLVRHLRQHAVDVATFLRDAGWAEDERGLWSRGGHRRMHLFDAHEVAKAQQACENETGEER